MFYFVDSSALVKHYRSEIGSQWMSDLLNIKRDWLVISAITEAEVLAMLARERKQQPKTQQVVFDRVIQQAQHDFTHGLRIIQPQVRAFVCAAEVAVSGDVRGCDAVQLGAALYFRELLTTQAAPLTSPLSVTFIAADDALLQAARSRLFAIDNPNLHP